MTRKKLVLHDQFRWLNHVNKSKKGNAYSDFFQKGKYWLYENPQINNLDNTKPWK